MDNEACGGVTLSGLKRYECREGKMYRSTLDESLWIKLPIQIVIEVNDEPVF